MVKLALLLCAGAGLGYSATALAAEPGHECDREVRESCPHAVGPVAVARCLQDNEAELHPDCLEAVTHPERSR